ncbi:hypothetical protein SAMN05421721_10316 [Ectothiorhodospira mobilis]|uniref:Uncharacterized protein n=1 Tax=Ectothiorhodospira mobilis TaxID=195064 RepID=A0A1I4PZF8_ECTMO|nr:hypothetical protein [Ectothiorhodospira mobilis]SFM33192.1 hypothetical protein SAMN05421721_10316 [Ectothiorhodospira mobilis]
MTVEALSGPWAGQPFLSAITWLLILMGLAYAARPWSHRVLHRGTRALTLLLRHAARAVRQARNRLRRGHLRYLRGVELRRLEARFDRAYRGVHLRVNRDLGGFPALERRILQQIETLEQDYHSARDQVPEEPAWVRTANALAAAPPKADPRVGQILEEIHDSMARAGREALEEYRRASQSRLETLKGLLPAWRELGERLHQLEHAVRALSEQTRHLDTVLGRYRRLRRGAVPARDIFLASTGLLAVSAAILALQGVAAGVLFFLVGPAMGRALGEGTAMEGMTLAPWAVGAVILTVVLGGGLVSEARRASRLIPTFTVLDPRMRRRSVALGGTLVFLAIVLLALLAASRDLQAVSGETLVPLLQGPLQGEMETTAWLSTFTCLVLGVLLPLPLALVALPLQIFLQSLGVVTGGLAVTALAVLAALLSWLALAVYVLGSVLRGLYELFIFIPLLLERGYRAWQRRRTVPREVPATLLSLPGSQSPGDGGTGRGSP